MTGLTTALRLTVRLNHRGVIIAILVLTAAMFGGTAGLAASYPTVAERLEYATITSALTASQALQGPPIGLSTVGGIAVFEVGWYVLIGVALLSIVLVIRGTRRQESLGYLELLRAGRHGPLATPVATMFAALVVNVIVGIGLGTALVLGGADAAGAAVFGVVSVATGLTFAAVALLATQWTEHTRGAYSMACGILGLSYLLRSLGDATDSSVLRHLSLLGLGQAIHPFGYVAWWPLLPLVVVTIAATGIALRIEATRDHGAGVFRPAPGPPHAGTLTQTTLGMIVRDQRLPMSMWAVTLLALGVGFGISAADVADLTDGPPGLRKLLAPFGVDIVDGFLAISTTLLSLVATGAGVAVVARLRGDEVAGRSDLLLAGTLARWRLALAHVALAAAAVITLLGLIGLSLGISHAVRTGNANEVGRLLGAALSQLPAVAVVAAVAIAAIGLLPRVSWLGWVVLGSSTVITVLGPSMNLPTPVMNLSVFHHVPRLPGAEVQLLPPLILTVLSCALTAAGIFGFTRRDLE